MHIPVCRISIAFFLHLALAVEPLQAASFDCAQARTLIEKTICLSPELSALDKEMADLYQSAIARGNPDQIRADQRRWLREIRNQCQTASCLIDAHKQRIVALAPAVPAAPAPRPLAQAEAPVAPVARSQNGVRECDRLAAHPDDPEAFTAGISDEQLDASATIRACEAAVMAEPHTPRLHFQLARGYLKADNAESGIEQLIAAAEHGHGAALATLADLHLSGAPGIEADPMLARTLYEKAVASGFEPAKKVLAEFEDMTDAYAKSEAEEQEAAKVSGGTSSGALKPYVMPNIIENIYGRKFDDVIYDELWSKDYLVNIADNIRAVCESHFTQREVEKLKAEAGADHYRLGQAAIGANLLGSMAALAQAMKDPLGAVMAQAANAGAGNTDPFEVGMKDTEALFQRHMCKTPGLVQFSKNLKAFVENEEAPLPAPDAIMNACLRNPPPSKYKPMDFCLCFGGGLNKARVSQAHRKNLVNNFRETAIAIMTIERNVSQFRVCRSGY